MINYFLTNNYYGSYSLAQASGEFLAMIDCGDLGIGNVSATIDSVSQL